MIPIVWGNRDVRDELGFVADFCPLCRTLRAFRFRRLGSASHVYFVSIPGEDSLVGYTRTCVECKATFGASPDQYSGISAELRSPESLVAETFPNYYDAYGERIALERKTPSQLTPEERRYRLSHAFLVTGEVAQQKFSHIKMDRGSWYAVGAGVFLYLVPGFLMRAASVDIDQHPAWIMIPGFAALAVVIIGLGLSGRRYAVSWALSILAGAVGALRPTDSELEEVLLALRKRDLKLGSNLRVADLQQAFETSRLGAPAGAA